MAEQSESGLAPLYLGPIAQQLAERFMAEVGIVMLRMGADGRERMDMGAPQSGEALESMAIGMLHGCLERSREGADLGCQACADRLERVEQALRLMSDGVETEGLSATSTEKVH